MITPSIGPRPEALAGLPARAAQPGHAHERVLVRGRKLRVIMITRTAHSKARIVRGTGYNDTALDRSGRRWYADAYPALPPAARPDHECVQRAGEVLYLPARFRHATVNLDAVVGLGLYLIVTFQYSSTASRHVSYRVR